MSSYQRSRINLLLFSLVFSPFITIFNQISNLIPSLESLSPSQILNYVLLLGSAYVFIYQKTRFSVRLMIAVAVLIFMLFMNYFLTPLASIKWLFNWLGFIFISLITAQSVKSLSGNEMQSFQTRALRTVKFILIALATLFSLTWAMNFSDLIRYILLGLNNDIISILSENLGVDKQALGTFLVPLVLLAFVCWPILSRSTRILFVITLLIIWPVTLGIRTMWLGLILCAAWVYVTKYRFRRVVTYLLISAATAVFIFYKDKILDLISETYDRLPALQFAWSVMTSNLFGIGNGGYHVFVEANNDAIVALFGSEQMVTTGSFWIAPESDLVYFIASWGLLSIIFFSFFCYILLRGGRIFHFKFGLFPIERVMLLMAGAMIFSGISQDNAGGLVWWVYMAAGFAVILRHSGVRRLVIEPAIDDFQRIGRPSHEFRN